MPIIFKFLPVKNFKDRLASIEQRQTWTGLLSLLSPGKRGANPGSNPVQLQRRMQQEDQMAGVRP